MQDMTIVAVDFGSKKFSASIGQQVEDDVDILGTTSVQSKGIEKGFIVDEEKAKNSFKELIQDLERKTNQKVTNIYAGISSKGIRTKESNAHIQLKEGKVTGYEIKKAIERAKREATIIEGEEVVDVIVNYYALDGKIAYENVVGWIGKVLEVNITIFLGPTNQLNKFRRIITESGYILKGFVINVVTGKNVFLDGKNAMGTKILLDVGAGTIDFAVFRNGVLKSLSNIPIGGNNITKDISICAKISMTDAENLKKIYSNHYETLKAQKGEETISVGGTIVDKTLFCEVVKARIEEILKYIQLEVKNTSFCEGMCSIIIYGDGISYFENMEEMAKKVFEKKVTMVTEKFLGMKNTENITSLAIVKEMCDRVSVLSNNSTKVEIEKNNEKEILREIMEEKKEKEGIVEKIKNFLREVF